MATSLFHPWKQQHWHFIVKKEGKHRNSAPTQNLQTGSLQAVFQWAHKVYQQKSFKLYFTTTERRIITPYQNSLSLAQNEALLSSYRGKKLDSIEKTYLSTYTYMYHLTCWCQELNLSCIVERSELWPLTQSDANYQWKNKEQPR